MSIHDRPLAHQVAQRLTLGYDGVTPDERLERFLDMGLGGVIFFRRNFQPLALNADGPLAIVDVLQGIRARMEAAGAPTPFLALDQEGGLIERLPHTLFPALVSPMALARALSREASNEFCAETYDLQAFYLAMLGFNVNFFPTLDVNDHPANPVIGVRSFGADPQTVWRFAAVALERMATRGVLAVCKHFPGHGGGDVDSHEALPALPFSDAHLEPFRRAIAAGAPAMMVAHGYYPALQDAAGEAGTPATLSPRIVGGLLRQELGFDGLVFSDDMTMGALDATGDPVGYALRALEAGVDMLVYRDCDDRATAVHEGICQALEDGRLSMDVHRQALARIEAAKARIEPTRPQPELVARVMTPDAIEAVSDFIAVRALRLSLENARQASPEGAARLTLPINPEEWVWTIAPDRAAIAHYADDAQTSANLIDWLEAGGLYPLAHVRYAPSEAIALPPSEPGETPPAIIVFVTYCPARYPSQIACYEALRARFPQSALLLVHAGDPCPDEWMPQADLRLDLCGWRPSSMKALAQILTRAPEPEAVRPSAQKPLLAPDDDEDVEYELAEDAQADGVGEDVDEQDEAPGEA